MVVVEAPQPELFFCVHDLYLSVLEANGHHISIGTKAQRSHIFCEVCYLFDHLAFLAVEDADVAAVRVEQQLFGIVVGGKCADGVAQRF